MGPPLLPHLTRLSPFPPSEWTRPCGLSPEMPVYQSDFFSVREMRSFLHLSQCNDDVATILHSFFIFQLDCTVEPARLKFVLKYPSTGRSSLDFIESSIPVNFLEDILHPVEGNDCQYSLKICRTKDQGRVYYLFGIYDASAKCLYVLVGLFPVLSFFRQIYAQLLQVLSLPTDAVNQSSEVDMGVLISCYLEIPFFPLPDVKYSFTFLDHAAQLPVGLLHNVEDYFFDKLPIFYLTPYMFVKVWEALLLEKNILVVCGNAQLLVMFCSFFHQLIYPLQYSGSYFPMIPYDQAHLFDPVGIFFMGIERKVFQSYDFSTIPIECIVVDIDHRIVTEMNTKEPNGYQPMTPGPSVSTRQSRSSSVTPPFTLKEGKEVAAPSALLRHLEDLIIEEIQQFTMKSLFTSSIAQISAGPSDYSSLATKVLSIFTECTISLLTAQVCQNESLFFTSPAGPEDPTSATGFKDCTLFRTLLRETVATPASLTNAPINGNTDASTKLAEMMIPSEFYGEKLGLTSGILALWKDSSYNSLNPLHHTFPCWVELDDETLSIYHHADEMPLYTVFVEVIESIAHVPVEPELCVFELVLKDAHSTNIRFTCIDKDLTNLWVNAIESRLPKTAVAAGNGVQTTPTQMHHQSLPRGRACSVSANTYTIIPPKDSRPEAPLGTVSAATSIQRSKLWNYFSSSYEIQQYLIDYYKFRNFIRGCTSPKHLLANSYLRDYDHYLPDKQYAYDRILDRFQQLLKPSSAFLRSIPSTDNLTSGSPSSSAKLSPVSSPPTGDRRSLLFYEPMMKDFISVIDRSEQQIFSLEQHIEQVLTERLRARTNSLVPTYGSTIVTLKAAALQHNRTLSEINEFFVLEYEKAFARFGSAEKQTEASKGPSKTIVEYNLFDLCHYIQMQLVNPYTESSSKSQTIPILSSTVSPLLGRFLTSILTPSTACELVSSVSAITLEDTSLKSKDFDEEISEDARYMSLMSTFRDCVSEYLEAHLMSLESSKPLAGERDPQQMIFALSSGYFYAIKHQPLQALQAYAPFAFAISQSHIAQCVLEYYLQQSRLIREKPVFKGGKESCSPAVDSDDILFEEANDALVLPIELLSLHELQQLSPLYGLHAYRLLVKMTYDEINCLMEEKTADVLSPYSFGTLRHFINRVANPAMKKKAKTTGVPTATADTGKKFDCELNASKTEILNEVYICKELGGEVTCLEVSVQLSQSIRECLKSYAVSSNGQRHCVRDERAKILRLKINNEVLNDLRNLTSVQKFIQATCKLQKCHIDHLNEYERIGFFVNIFNTLMVHSILVKENPGTAPLQRISFMKSGKYRIGGQIYSLLDIEHGILRNKLMKYPLLGPFLFDMSLSDRDPRHRYAIQSRIPNVSFVLFQACASSPPLRVMRKFNNSKQEMDQMAQEYLLQSIIFDQRQKTIFLPAFMDVYKKDFSEHGSNHEIIKKVTEIVGDSFKHQVKEFLEILGPGTKCKPDFCELDYTPMFILNL